MRTVLVVLIASCLAWSAGAISNQPTVLELSHDSGPQSSFVYLSGSGFYMGAQFDLPAGGPWYLQGIKYYVWSSWPDSIYQGFLVACWKMVSGTPGPVVWPTDGDPIFNPNTGGGWIIQQVSPEFNLTQGCPNGFLVGVGQLYTYPACDALGISDDGPGPYDWCFAGGVWGAAPYNPCIRAIIDDEYPEEVEPVSLGSLRALYR